MLALEPEPLLGPVLVLEPVLEPMLVLPPVLLPELEVEGGGVETSVELPVLLPPVDAGGAEAGPPVLPPFDDVGVDVGPVGITVVPPPLVEVSADPVEEALPVLAPGPVGDGSMTIGNVGVTGELPVVIGEPNGGVEAELPGVSCGLESTGKLAGFEGS